MLRCLFSLVILCAGTLHAGLPPALRPLADVPVPLPGGKKLDLKQYRGKALVFAVVSSDCQPCGDVTEFLKKMQAEYGPQGLQVVAAIVEADGAAHVAGFAAAHKPNFPVGYLELDGYRKIVNVKPNVRIEAPIVMFVDPQGAVRVQLHGDDPLMKQPELILRGTIRELVKEVPAAAKK